MCVCVRVNGELSKNIPMQVRVIQRCVMSPWLFNDSVNGCMKEMKPVVGNVGAKLEINGMRWTVMA